MSAPTQSTAHQLLASIDVTPYTQTAACGTDPSHPHAGCGAATSLVFDAAGNLYIGTVDGTNKILKFSSSGTLLSQYSVPVGARGAGWIACSRGSISRGWSIGGMRPRP
jgi:sugar lactone lactonase YvrE